MRPLNSALLNRKSVESAVSGAGRLALEEVYRLHVQDVARWARRLGGPGVDVEDVSQEVFLAVHRQLPTFREECALSTWLFRITENVIRHRRRKDRWLSWLSTSAEDQADHLESPEPGAHAQLEESEATARLYRVLNGMSEKYRRVLILFELEELSGEEISQLTGAKTATIWVWLHRARADFAKRLAALEAEERR